MKMVEKAQHYDEIIQEQHTPLGLVFDVFPPSNVSPIRYADVEDSAIWTGAYIASQAFRFSVTGNQRAMENIERSLFAIHELRMITAKEGLLARGFLKGTSAPANETEWHKGTGDYENYVWKGDVSRDQYLGIFFGLAVAFPFIQSEVVKNMILVDIHSLADHIIDNNLHIIDVDGKPTQYGNFSVRPFNVDGLSAILALAIIRIAHNITGDEKFRRYYTDYLIRSEQYHKIAWQWLGFGLELFRNYVNYNMAFMALYSLITVEIDSELKLLYLNLLDKIWINVKDDLNSFFTFIHHGMRGIISLDEAIRGAIQSLELFPFPLVNRVVENSKDPSISKSFFLDRKWRRQAKYPLPMDHRVPSNFIWKENPRLLDGGSGNGRIFHPASYLVAYWMGRYYRLISEYD